MGHLIDDFKKEKHIETNESNNEKKIKQKTYEQIKDIVMGKNEKVVIEKKNIKNKDNIKKPTVDIGL